MHVPAGDTRADERREHAQRGVNARAGAARRVQSRDREHGAHGDHGHALEDAERAGFEMQHVLRAFRRQCKTLVAMGACAINGGLPAQRNHLSVADCLREVYQFRPGLADGRIPDDPELPLPLDKVRPLHEVVRVDYFLPGCPPSGAAVWKFLSDLLAGRTPRLTGALLHYD